MSIVKNFDGSAVLQRMAVVKLEDQPGRYLMVALSDPRPDGRREVLVGYLTWALFLEASGQLEAKGWPEIDDAPKLKDVVEATVRDLAGIDVIPAAGGHAAKGGDA